ncbi:unnamed protein product [Bursaphelenchus okinawaensis]|uniref:Uncharacterized protein n=1 Tax=Bursaphelenchus okinawaensis TaxID=465554 RepID=A0A811LKM2_9BILA|nr:unnamed protein product [Bursaphelenchus okinawaensis]CAG9124229.1 unnamed protein product [Bursaphelenchus okinawaensis]
MNQSFTTGFSTNEFVEDVVSASKELCNNDSHRVNASTESKIPKKTFNHEDNLSDNEFFSSGSCTIVLFDQDDDLNKANGQKDNCGRVTGKENQDVQAHRRKVAEALVNRLVAVAFLHAFEEAVKVPCIQEEVADLGTRQCIAAVLEACQGTAVDLEARRAAAADLGALHDVVADPEVFQGIVASPHRRKVLVLTLQI